MQLPMCLKLSLMHGYMVVKWSYVFVECCYVVAKSFALSSFGRCN